VLPKKGLFLRKEQEAYFSPKGCFFPSLSSPPVGGNGREGKRKELKEMEGG